MSQAETASEPHPHPVDEPASSSLGATSIAAVDAPPPYTSLESENGNKPAGLTETYPKDNTKMVQIASPSSSSPSSPSSVLSASTLSSSPETPTTLSAAMTPAMAEVAIATAIVSASNFDTDAPATPEATISTTTNNGSESIATPSPFKTTSATTSTTPPSTTISTAPVVNIKDNKATPSSPLSPLPSPPSSSSSSSSTMVTDKDKGHPIPTSNALSYSLKSRLSSAAPLSSLSSVTPSSIISPKPYSSYHTTVTSSSLSTSPSTSSQPLSPTKDGRPLNPVSIYSSSSSKSFEQEDEEAKDYSSYPYVPRVSMSSAKDRYSTSPVYQRQQESEYEDEEEEEGDDDEYEMDEEYGSDSGLPMEHDSGLPYEHDTEMADINTRSSPHPTSAIDTSKAASTSTSTTSPQLAPQETNTATPTTSTSASTSTPATTATTAAPAKKNGVSATSCANCGTTTTPLWRRASDGQTICNACGLYFKARNSTRPPWLKRNMGLKKGDTSTGETEELEDPAQPAPSADASNGDANEASKTGETKGDAESCPGDGNCNGIGGAHTCSGCPSFNQQHTNRQNLICANCRTTTTPLWRRDSSGNTICNACGLYFKLHNVHRPVTMKRAVIKRRKPAPTTTASASASTSTASSSSNAAASSSSSTPASCTSSSSTASWDPISQTSYSQQDATNTEPGIRGSISQTQAPLQLWDWSE
ncbi:putative electron transfer flavoprotein subunit [Mortierella antarctica]|nr:putative electron transfer flavoprotein subunit [Mortierella antarctica]